MNLHLKKIIQYFPTFLVKRMATFYGKNKITDAHPIIFKSLLWLTRFLSLL